MQNDVRTPVIDRHGELNNDHFGFRPTGSTSELVYLTHNVTETILRGYYVTPSGRGRGHPGGQLVTGGKGSNERYVTVN